MKPKPDPVISATYVIHNGRHHNYVRDWQGNIRNDRDYYPYGLPTSVSSIPESDSYGFSGKEFEQFRGLNLYDFEARTYVPDEARFWQPDPMADDYPGISPYAYCAGDPINHFDPNRMETIALANDSIKTYAAHVEDDPIKLVEELST